MASKRFWYRYRLVAIDEAGNQGGSKVVSAKPINDGLRDPIGGFMSLTPPDASEEVSLTWTYPLDIDLIGFQIYRGFDSTAVRSYRFFPVPPPNNSTEMLMSPEGNGHRFSFVDRDMDFKIPVQTEFVFPNNPANPNKALPPPNTGATTSTFVIPNPNVPPPGVLTGTKIYYWVMAQFADGSTSPLAGFVEVVVE